MICSGRENYTDKSADFPPWEWGDGEPVGKDDIIICMNSSARSPVRVRNIWCSGRWDHYKWAISQTRPHCWHRSTRLPGTDPYSNSAAPEGCASSRDNPQDRTALLWGNIWASFIYHRSQSSLALSLHKFFSTSSSVPPHLTLEMRSVTSLLSLCNLLLVLM